MIVKDKVVLVTGASGGIGRAAALQFANEGASLILTYNKNNVSFKDLENKLEHIKASYTSIQTDITNVENIKQVFSVIKEKNQKIDVLVNIAGIEPVLNDPLDTKEWGKVISVNLFAPVEFTREAVKLMKKSGVIINISSVAGNSHTAYDFNAISYAVSKAALTKFTEVCAHKFAPDIRFISISPGYVKTPMWHITKEEEKEFAQKVPNKRFIMPEEIADLIVYVCKNEAITGENITIDGGLSLKYLL